MKIKKLFLSNLLILPLLVICSCNEIPSTSNQNSNSLTNNSESTTNKDGNTNTQNSSLEEDINEISLTQVEGYDKTKDIYQGDEINKIISPTLTKSEHGELSVSYSSTNYGNTNKVTAVPHEGYRVAAIFKDDIYLSSKSTASFYNTANNKLSALYVKEEKFLVICLDESYRFISSLEVNKNDNIEQTFYKENKDYTLKIENVEKLSNIEEDVLLIPRYVKKGSPSINVSSPVKYDDKTYNYGDAISFTTPQSYNNKFFSYYLLNNEIVSYYREYKTICNENINLQAIYLDSVSAEFPNVSMSSTSSIINDKLVLNGSFSSYKNATLVDFGFIYKENKDLTYKDYQLTHSLYTYSEEINSFSSSLDNKEGYYQSYIVYRFIQNNLYLYKCFFSNIYKY